MTHSTLFSFKHRNRLFPGSMICFLILFLTLCNSVSAEQPAGNQAVILTADQADAILGELKEIRKLLESIDKKGGTQAAAPPTRPAVPQTAKVSTDGGMSLGAADAVVTVVEFTDFQCPYCRRFVQETYPKLKQEFIDSGKVKWIVRDMPLGFHKNARKAAQAAHCAGDQGKYWEMRGVLFANSKELEAEKLTKYASQVGLDMTAFDACLASDRHLAAIDQSVREAGSVKITGTPTFVIGKAEGNIVDGTRIVGARDLKSFQDAIQKLLATDTDKSNTK